jgi:hypothetical protein
METVEIEINVEVAGFAISEQVTHDSGGYQPVKQEGCQHSGCGLPG